MYEPQSRSYGRSLLHACVRSWEQKTSNLYNRRSTKLASTVGSLFTSAFVFHWPEYFKSTPLAYPPSFDARVNMRDYLSWRHVDCHINNLYNTCFWALVQTGDVSPKDAEALLQHTDAKAKHELLFSQFNINYNDVSLMFKRGSTLFRTPDKSIAIAHVDLIKDQAFWTAHVPLLDSTHPDNS
ncbi:hypothetical protein DYB32_010212 [Aphanomyces invadans]|uniref:tRNA(His) guanylyltransferase n=1 Tax=Aphanomyces invadans TaxID=157072 RepID=A0A3R6VPK0_9STRA|nr:hypothetical protein DYB32_010212 [Aphanomyces invadans]